MKFVKRLFMGIGGLAAAAALLTVLSPRAHALVATLVEVANTRSTPVPNQDVDHPGRHPYQQQCTSFSSGCTMPIVPPNTEVVIQMVSVYTNGVSLAYSGLGTTAAGNTVSTFIPLVAVGGGNFVGTQQITQYMDPGTAATCANPIFNSDSFSCTISGYTVSLP
jgi:hypothetical protein